MVPEKPARARTRTRGTRSARRPLPSISSTSVTRAGTTTRNLATALLIPERAVLPDVTRFILPFPRAHQMFKLCCFVCLLFSLDTLRPWVNFFSCHLYTRIQCVGRVWSFQSTLTHGDISSPSGIGDVPNGIPASSRHIHDRSCDMGVQENFSGGEKTGSPRHPLFSLPVLC